MVAFPILNKTSTFNQINQSVTSLSHISRAYRKELKVTSTTLSTCLVDITSHFMSLMANLRVERVATSLALLYCTVIIHYYLCYELRNNPNLTLC